MEVKSHEVVSDDLLQPFYARIVQLAGCNPNLQTFIRACPVSNSSKDMQVGKEMIFPNEAVKRDKHEHDNEQQEQQEQQTEEMDGTKEVEEKGNEQETMRLLLQQMAYSLQHLSTQGIPLEQAHHDQNDDGHQHDDNECDTRSTQAQQTDPELLKAMHTILGSITGDLRSTMTIKDTNVSTDIETFRCRLLN